MPLKEITPQYQGKIVCSMREYHAASAVGSSSLRPLLDETPLHYLAALKKTYKTSPAKEFGTAIHQAILEPKRFKELAVIDPGFSGKGSVAARNEWHLDMTGRTILTKFQYDGIQCILKSISEHDEAAPLVSAGHAEESLFWKDPETGIQLKCRPDFVREGRIVVDVKSAKSISYFPFQSDFNKYSYPMRAAMYLDGCSAVLEGNFDTYIILAVENHSPWAVRCFPIKAHTIQQGRSDYQRALALLKQCYDSGKFPGYTGLTPIESPAYAIKEDL